MDNTDQHNTYDELHPHQRDGRNEPVVVDGKGRCLVCSRDLLDELRIQHALLLTDLDIANQRGDGWRNICREILEQIEILKIKLGEIVADNIRLRDEKEEQLKEENYLKEK
jgi:hypothetical protein